jgi:hypothetical protein
MSILAYEQDVARENFIIVDNPNLRLVELVVGVEPTRTFIPRTASAALYQQVVEAMGIEPIAVCLQGNPAPQ